MCYVSRKIRIVGLKVVENGNLCNGHSKYVKSLSMGLVTTFLFFNCCKKTIVKYDNLTIIRPSKITKSFLIFL